MKPPFKLDYDEGSDVLYISGSDNRPASGYMREGGILVRFANDDGELVGITIIGASSFMPKILHLPKEELADVEDCRAVRLPQRS